MAPPAQPSAKIHKNAAFGAVFIPFASHKNRHCVAEFSTEKPKIFTAV
jgi:hypothetical protein